MLPADLAAVLRAVRRGDDPHAPRALADWLEEHGGEADRARADYIRLDLRIRECPQMAGQAWAEEHLAELRRRYGPVWMGKGLILRGVQRWTIDRGLLWVWLRPPILKKGRLAVVTHLAQDGWLGGLRCEGWKAKSLGRLFRAPELQGVPALEAVNCRNGPAPVSRLAASPHLEALERLRLVNCGLGPASARRLAKSESLPALAVLELPFNRVGSPGLAALAASPLWRRLSRLNLEGNDIGPSGARAAARRLPAGLHLKLSFNRLGCRGAACLARSPGMGRLASLDLAWNGIGAVGGEALVAAPTLPPVLQVDGNDLGLAYQSLRARMR